MELGPWLPGTPEPHGLYLSIHPRPECEIPRKTAGGMRLGLSGKESPFYKRENWEPRERRNKAVFPGSLVQGDVNSDTRSQGQGSGKPIDLPGLPVAQRPGLAGTSRPSCRECRNLKASGSKKSKPRSRQRLVRRVGCGSRALPVGGQCTPFPVSHPGSTSVCRTPGLRPQACGDRGLKGAEQNEPTWSQ